MGTTEALVSRAVRLRLDDVPGEAVAVAKTTLLDTVAVAIAARNERAVRAVHGFVRSEAQGGPTTVWGSSLAAGPARAALANGTAAHALDFDDVCWAMNAHPSTVLWPAVLAVCEARSLGGADALLAYVAGFEAEAELGRVLGRQHYAMGFHPTATLGVVGATVAAGKALGLDEPTLRRAVGIACSQAAGSRMNFGTDTKPLHAGLAAQAGVTSALLADAGLTAREDGIEADMGLVALYGGAPDTGSRPRFALVEPGVELKPYPSCRFTHRIIDAALAVRSRSGDERIASIECTVDPFSEKIVIYPRPTTGQEAKFSMQYCAAVAWLDGVPGPLSFTDERARRNDVQSLLARVVLRHGSEEAESVTLHFEDGTADTALVRAPKGSPRSPLTREERLTKALACTVPHLGQRAHHLVELAERFEHIDRVAALVSLLPVPDAPAAATP